MFLIKNRKKTLYNVFYDRKQGHVKIKKKHTACNFEPLASLEVVIVLVGESSFF